MNKVISAIALMCLSVGIHNALASSANELPIVSDKEEINSSTNNSDDELEGWMFYANAKLYYKDGGRWKYYGTYPVYSNPADNEDGCNLWVRFSKYSFMPVSYHRKNNIEWPHRVMYQGVYYYF